MRPILLLLFWGAAGLLSAQSTMNLQQALQFAQENSEQIKLARLNMEDADAQIVERRAFGIPQLSADVGYTRFLALPVTILPAEFGLDPATGQPNPDFDRKVRFGLKNNLTGTLALRAMVFDPSYFVGLQAARAYRDYTAQELASAQSQVRYNVLDAFLPALLLQENISNLDANLRNLERLRQETFALYSEGFAELLDVERLDLSIFSLRTEKESLVNQREQVINGLKASLAYPMDQPLDVSGTLDEIIREPSTLPLEGRIDYQAWPDYRVALQGLNLSQLNVRLNRYAYMPSLDAFANVQRMYMGDSFSDGVWANAALAGLSLKVPIFDGLLTHARIQRAEITRKTAEVQIGQLEQQISMSVQNARMHYQHMQDRLANQDRHLALAEKIYQTTQVKYREGIGSSLETNQAEQALFLAQRQHIQARYDLIQAYFLLEKALGR